MDIKKLSLIHQIRSSSLQSPPMLLLLHGYGANEHDLHALAPSIDPRFLVVSPRAPLPVMAGAYGWFNIAWTSQGAQIERTRVVAARAGVVQFVEEAIAAYGADSTQVYLAGFSQGAIMSAAALLLRPRLFAGALLMSGSANNELVPSDVDHAALAGKPVLITHGLYDQVLPIDNGRRSRETFAQLPVDLVYREYPMGHEINAKSLEDVTSWLRERLAVRPS